MSLIYFNNVVSMEVPELDMVGIYRVLAISTDVSMAALVPIPIVTPSTRSNGRISLGVSDIKRIALAVLQLHEQSEKIRQVELRNDPALFLADSAEDAANSSIYARRREVMTPFLLHDQLSWALFSGNGLGSMVREATAKYGCSRGFVYKLFSLLCIHGFSPSSLHPRFDRCGAPGVARPCDGNRRKAGRKTSREKLGAHEPNPQRGVSSEDRTRIAAMYQTLKRPELTDVKVYREIIQKLYVTRFFATAHGVTPDIPSQGTFPNLRQFRYIVSSEFARLDRLKIKTTQGHFNRNMRGLKGRSWQEVAGPGHKYAIDSTMADVFLVSSINRAWVCGRPIVYIVVDVWSTAIVGFFLCWSGPSWEMAKVALFCASADRGFISSLWGFEESLWLDPQPTLPASFLSDRGEYLSEAARKTSLELQYSFEINPSYRPDLKGLVEVLNRVAKDEQYGFVPGAIDARRKELELKGNGKFEAVLTLHEYARYLTIIFNSYNLSADRSSRLDAEMIAANVQATPAGLWAWGHRMGYGYRRFIDTTYLIKHLLPQERASITRSGVHFAGLAYESPIADKENWTADARNFGAIPIPIHYFPGSTSRIWNLNESGFHQLHLSPHAKAKPTACIDEWMDAFAVSRLKTGDREFRRTYEAAIAQYKTQQIVESAREATHAAKSFHSAPHPKLREVRNLEKSALNMVPDTPVDDPKEFAKQGVEAHSKLISHLFSIANAGDENGD